MWNPFRKDPIDEELRFHAEQLRQERLDAGDTPLEAALYARRVLGNNLHTEEQVREISILHGFETILRHCRFAMRSFARHGGAYLLATAILALGIGLSVAMFSLVQAVVLSPLPFPNQESIQMVWKTDAQTNGNLVGELAFPELRDLQESVRDLEYAALIPAALYGNGRVLEAGTAEPVQIESCPVTADFFRVLGVTPMLGHDFETKDQDPGSSPVVILSHSVWREHFASNHKVIGQQIRLNGVGHTVIGVMAADVDFPRGARLWVPIRTDTRRGMTYLQAVVRLKPGASIETLRIAVNRTFQLQALDHPEEYPQSQRAVVTPIATYLTGSSKAQLLLSLAASLLLLLSACVSASNLFLSRAMVRRREVLTRTSLGASTFQILSQFAVEGLLAASIATFAGSMLAVGTIRVLIHLAPPDIPRIETAWVNLAALVFAASTALCAAVACAIGPALLVRKDSLESLLREGGMRTAGSRTGRRLQNLFVFSQAALTVAILTVGLLLFISYRSMLQTDIGFGNRDTLTMNLALRGPKVDPAIRRHFYKEILDRLRAAPEVTSAAAVLLRPLEGPIGWDASYTFEFEAGQRDPKQLPKANFEAITPHYFETVGTALLEGRDFNEYDAEESEKVIIINQSLANQIRAAGYQPIGQRLSVFGALRKVVGVAANARYRRVVQPADDLYVPYRQVNTPTNYLVLRGVVPAGELLTLVRRTLKEIDPGQAIASVASLDELILRDTARNRFNLVVMMLFVVGAVLLAASGIHSVVGESVAVRAKEMAVKTALGAARWQLVSEAITSALMFVAAGELAGVLIALALGRATADLLYGVSPSDPAVLLGVSALVFCVAVIASFIPAWIATGRDPFRSLQAD